MMLLVAGRPILPQRMDAGRAALAGPAGPRHRWLDGSSRSIVAARRSVGRGIRPSFIVHDQETEPATARAGDSLFSGFLFLSSARLGDHLLAIKSMRKSARPPVSKQRIAEAGADGEHGPFVDVPHEWHLARSLDHGVVVHHDRGVEIADGRDRLC